MKNIKELGLELIELEDQIVLVDRKLPVFTDEWGLELYNGKSKATTPKWIDDTNNVWWLRRMNMNCQANDPECIKVVASTKQLDNIPLLVIKDGVKKLATKTLSEQDWWDTSKGLPFNEGYLKGFKHGFKKARETFKFTEEDLRKMYDLSCGKIGLDLLKDQTENNKRFKSFLDNITKKELFIEIEGCSDCHLNDGYMSSPNCCRQVQPKTKNGKIKAIWK